MSNYLEDNDLLARWLDNRLSDEEQKRLEASGDLKDLEQVIGDVGQWRLPAFDTSKGLTALKEQLNTPAPKAKKFQLSSIWKYAVAASLMLLAYFAVQEYLLPNTVSYKPQAQETEHIELPDGSTVSLDASSELSYISDDWLQERSLDLQGQAFFEVAKGSSFTVSTPQGNVRVLGTQFNVKTTEQGLGVVCYEGSVEVGMTDVATKHILQPGEGIRLSATKATRFSTDEKTPSWIQGDGSSVRYNNTPLQEVATDLSRQYGISCKLPKQYQALKFSGIVPRYNLERALKTIFVPMEIPYSVHNEGIYFNP